MSELLKINKKDITEEKGFNTRFDMGDLREIRANMEQNGFNAAFPVIVRIDPKNPTKYILASQGHRRMAVAWDLDSITNVFAVLEDENVSEFDRNLDIIRLNTGKELNLLEQSRVVMRALAKEGITQGEVAKLVGKSAMHITQLVKLSKITKQTAKWIESDKISATEVINIIDELEAKTEEGFQKVEDKIERLLAKTGDKKVTRAKTEKDEKEEKETEEEKAAREEEEKAEADVKAANKLRLEAGKRGQKFADAVSEIVVKSLESEANKDKLTPLQNALLDLEVTIASFLSGKGTDSTRAFVEGAEASKLSDVWASARALEKVHKETVKETVSELKEEAKEQVKAVKDQVKTVKEEAAEKIKAAKAKATKPKAE